MKVNSSGVTDIHAPSVRLAQTFGWFHSSLLFRVVIPNPRTDQPVSANKFSQPLWPWQRQSSINRRLTVVVGRPEFNDATRTPFGRIVTWAFGPVKIACKRRWRRSVHTHPLIFVFFNDWLPPYKQTAQCSSGIHNGPANRRTYNLNSFSRRHGTVRFLPWQRSEANLEEKLLPPSWRATPSRENDRWCFAWIFGHGTRPTKKTHKNKMAHGPSSCDDRQHSSEAGSGRPDSVVAFVVFGRTHCSSQYFSLKFSRLLWKSALSISSWLLSDRSKYVVLFWALTTWSKFSFPVCPCRVFF